MSRHHFSLLCKNSNDTARVRSFSFRQDFLGSAATQFPELVTIIDTGISVLCNALFIIAIVYAFAAIALVVWPQSLVKVRTGYGVGLWRKEASAVRAIRTLLNNIICKDFPCAPSPFFRCC